MAAVLSLSGASPAFAACHQSRSLQGLLHPGIAQLDAVLFAQLLVEVRMFKSKYTSRYSPQHFLDPGQGTRSFRLAKCVGSGPRIAGRESMASFLILSAPVVIVTEGIGEDACACDCSEVHQETKRMFYNDLRGGQPKDGRSSEPNGENGELHRSAPRQGNVSRCRLRWKDRPLRRLRQRSQSCSGDS
jgi:hypothetical protein